MLIHKRKVPLLDESTSVLEVEPEKFVQTAIDNIVSGDGTTITIANRLSAIQNAHLIVLLKVAMLSSRKPMGELPELKGDYLALVRQQSAHAN